MSQGVQRESLRRADSDACRATAGDRSAGVPVAMGSDVGPFPHGTQAREFVLMVKYGMTPLASLQAGTINAAKLLGWQGQIGALKPGYFADVVAVPGNPLENIRQTEHVVFVMKEGVIYRNDRAAAR